MNETSKKIQYTFFGKVHPERCNVSIPEFRAQIEALDNGITGELRYSISLSQVTATFNCVTPVSNIFTLKNYAEDAIRVALDALGYTLGCGYDLEIIQMIDSLGNHPVVFGVGISKLEKSASEAGLKFENILDVFKDSKGGYLQRCLADLREAIRAPKDTGFFCYRAIESLRQYFIHETGARDEKVSWEELRSELGIHRTEIERVKTLADPVRHGYTVAITADQRDEITMLTWKIVNQFIKYANAGYRKN